MMPRFGRVAIASCGTAKLLRVMMPRTRLLRTSSRSRSWRLWQRNSESMRSCASAGNVPICNKSCMRIGASGLAGTVAMLFDISVARRHQMIAAQGDEPFLITVAQRVDHVPVIETGLFEVVREDHRQ